VAFYDELVLHDASPSARLSRAIALGFRDGARAGLAALDGLASVQVVRELAAFHAARGDAFARLGERARAREAYLEARELATNACEERYIERRITTLEA
jgi:predicted RNA polymerase sigma factor